MIDYEKAQLALPLLLISLTVIICFYRDWLKIPSPALKEGSSLRALPESPNP